MATTRSVGLFASMRPADPLMLGDVGTRLARAGIDGLHVDVADGTFVPYMTTGPDLARALAVALPDLLVDVHLMTVNAEARIRDLEGSWVRRVAFHIEADLYPWRIISLARAMRLEVGVAVNPVTPLAYLEAVASSVDFIVVLTTDPDHAGEHLLPQMVERVASLRRLAPATTRIEVDGGVSASTAADFVASGADDLVVGRAIIAAPDWQAAIAELRASIERGKTERACILES